MSSIVELGPLQGDAAKPVFRASAGGVDFWVELDSSALHKLGRSSVIDWRDAVEAERGRIRSAAQYLFDGGFLTEVDDELRLFLTAIDLV